MGIVLGNGDYARAKSECKYNEGVGEEAWVKDVEAYSKWGLGEDIPVFLQWFFGEEVSHVETFGRW